MQEPNSAEKQIQASFESLKVQIEVGEGELQSKDGVKRIVKKYQGRIAEMLKLIQKQKRQNDSLKSQFRQLNDQLNSVLKKVQQKPKQEEHKITDSRDQLTKKQLQNEIKKNGILRKEIEQLRYKFQYLNGQQIDALKNQIKQKDRSIEELNSQIRLFEKLDKQEKNGDSYKKQQELNHKIMQLNEEVLHLKKKTQEQKKKEEELQKTVKHCRELNLTIQTKLAAKPANEDKHKDKQADEQLKQELDKLKEKYKQLQNAKKMTDKVNKHEIDSLSLKIKSTERQLIETKQVISRKEKESNIIMFKLKEKERKNFNTLEPIKTARYSQEVLHTSSGGLFETRKQFRGLGWGQGIFREFDDSSKLPIEKNYRIKRMTFTYFEQHILSLTTDYDIIEGDLGKSIKKQTKTIESFAIPTQFSNIKIVEHLFGDYEYIINFDIYCGKGLEYLRLVTSKEHILQVGSPRSIPKCKHYSFQIASHQKPIGVMGVIQNRKCGNENRQYFVNMGLQLRRKQIFVRGKSRKIESSLNRSILNKSNNDKNKNQ